MTPSPILKALSTFSTHQVRYLLMGGQACVFYGAAEFSRDCDVAVLCDASNLNRLTNALEKLLAERIAIPPFSEVHLLRGHAVHFRCRHPDAERLRIDVMSKMRGVDEFAALWDRRTVLEMENGLSIHLMAIEDLVRAKRTQRDKDWPMIRRLVEAHFNSHQVSPTDAQVRFWLHACRTPSILTSLAQMHPELTAQQTSSRPLLQHAAACNVSELTTAIAVEEADERAKDREYWEPLRKELETMRMQQRTRGT